MIVVLCKSQITLSLYLGVNNKLCCHKLHAHTLRLVRVDESVRLPTVRSASVRAVLLTAPNPASLFASHLEKRLVQSLRQLLSRLCADAAVVF